MRIRQTTGWVLLVGCLAGSGASCGGKAAPPAPVRAPAPPKTPDVKAKSTMFLSSYLAEFAQLEKAANLAHWKASNSGKKEDFDLAASATVALKNLHSNSKRYAELTELLTHKDELSPEQARSLEVAELAFKENQLPPEMIKQLVDAATEIEQVFNTFRGEVAGKKYSNNELLQMLAKERNSKKRQAVWEALKQVGASVAPKLVKLAKVRNEAAKQLGFANFWDMQVRLQEHDPARVLAIFEELDRLTLEPFKQMKAKMDAERARRFGIKPDSMMPWHYDNPFFQDAPPSAKVDLDEFYEKKTKEDIVAIAKHFYEDIGLSVDPILANSDLFEREGKDQHAFCQDMDREGDVRVLTNIKPTADWMDTTLHELGHGLYSELHDRKLPFNLRDAAHIFTTEGIAMLFGALAKNPTWVQAYAGADEKRVKKVEEAMLEQRKREQLIFVRWTLVMLNFEKALYENPDQDLNKLWWDDVERYQMLKRPADRNAPDWASKPHFTIAPVYYHNYMLGELFAAQLRNKLVEMSKHEGSPSTLSFSGRKDIGEFLTAKVFAPGRSEPWPKFVQEVTGHELSAQYLAKELE